MNIVDNLGDYFKEFNRPLEVSVISKMTKWPNLQSLGHDANLKDLKKNFHGLVDAKVQFLKHTMANPRVLLKSWQAILPMLPMNLMIQKLMIADPVLGSVGKMVMSYPGMGKVFSVKAGELTTNASVTPAHDTLLTPDVSEDVTAFV